MMRDLTLVFDLDGTLVDTAPDLIRATNFVLESRGIEPLPPEPGMPSTEFRILY